MSKVRLLTKSLYEGSLSQPKGKNRWRSVKEFLNKVASQLDKNDLAQLTVYEARIGWRVDMEGTA